MVDVSQGERSPPDLIDLLTALLGASDRVAAAFPAATAIQLARLSAVRDVARHSLESLFLLEIVERDIDGVDGIRSEIQNATMRFQAAWMSGSPDMDKLGLDPLLDSLNRLLAARQSAVSPDMAAPDVEAADTAAPDPPEAAIDLRPELGPAGVSGDDDLRRISLIRELRSIGPLSSPPGEPVWVPRKLPPLPPEPVVRKPRYANAALYDAGSGAHLSRQIALRPDHEIRLRLDIGALTTDSDVINPRAVPEDLLPRGPIRLDVLVSSTHFAIAPERNAAPGNFAQSFFVLPESGAAATAPNGQSFVDFHLKAPPAAGPARCRIGYYFRNTLVQSQILRADIGAGAGYAIETDFTLSKDLTGLEKITDRPRLSILTNDNGNGSHQIVLRSLDPDTKSSDAATYTIDADQIGSTIKELHDTLYDRAPSTARRGKDDLIRDLRALAPIGDKLRLRSIGQAPRFFVPLYKRPDRFVVQIQRPSWCGFVFPWAFIYGIPLGDNPSLCKAVEDWDGKAPLLGDGSGGCKYKHEDNVLCPFGFWGYAYAIEQLTTSPEVHDTIKLSGKFKFVVAETKREVNLADLEVHVEKLRTMLHQRFPDAEFCPAADVPSLKTLLKEDLPFVYFYCHGTNNFDGDPDTWLEIGDGEPFTADTLKNWVQSWALSGVQVWDTVCPLVFLNACHSLALYPKTLVSYLEAFLGAANAAGIIGTEVRVDQTLAMSVASEFFAAFLAGDTVETALRRIRLDYLSQGNLFGLVYTPYCLADLRIAATV